MMAELPSSIGGPVTQEVAYFDAAASDVARWIQESLGTGWSRTPAEWDGATDAVEHLTPARAKSRYAVVPVGAWAAMLNNGPLGTDVGMLPSRFTRKFGRRGIRAVTVEDADSAYPARILEVFGADGEPPLMARRTIAAANDGGKWIFETTGPPFEFEDLERYRCRRAKDRFTSGMLHEYLHALGIPITVEPGWTEAFLIQHGH